MNVSAVRIVGFSRDPFEEHAMLSEMTRTAELEEPQNLQRHRREVFAERIGWLLVALVLFAALLGLLGPGLLSNRTVASQDESLTVQYCAIERYEAPSELRIDLRPSAVRDGIVSLTLSRSFTDETSLEALTPEPDTIEMQDDRIVCHFRVAGLTRDGRIVYRYQHNSFGRLRYTVGLLPSSTIDITQFVLP